MASKLSVYNQVLVSLGVYELRGLAEHRPERQILDTVWAPALRYCLARGQWNFATRAVQATPSSTEEATFGYSNVYEKPGDWVRTTGFCSDDRFEQPIRDYQDEQGFWCADLNPVYIRYVSDDPAYGGNLALWSTTFERFVVAHICSELYARFSAGLGMATTAAGIQLRKKDEKDRLKEAQSEDAMNQPSQRVTSGAWVRARRGNGSRYDRWDGTFR